MSKIIGLNLFKKSPFCQRNINVDKYLLSEKSVGIDYKKVSTQDTFVRVITKAMQTRYGQKRKKYDILELRFQTKLGDSQQHLQRLICIWKN